MKPTLPQPVPHWYARFIAKVEVDAASGCWIWKAARNHQGYGKFQLATRTTRPAHRVAYEAFHGAIPAGMVLDHFACDNKSCVNPDHVRPVSPRENVLRSNSLQAQNRAKTHCHRGHEFTPDNTIATRGGRSCRACQYAHHLAWRQRRRAVA